MLTIALLAALFAIAAALPLLRRKIALNLTARLGRLGGELRATGDAGPDIDRSTLPSLRAQHAYLTLTLPDRLSSKGSLLYTKLRDDVSCLERCLQEVRAGRDPLRGATGLSLRAFPDFPGAFPVTYSLRVPAAYDPGRPWPLIVHLHGRGMLKPFQGHPAPDYGEDAVVMSPHGGGSVDFMGPGEREVLAALDEVCRLYSIDADRVYLAGASMGGTGAWHLGAHYPDRFAAVVACSANADASVWAELWEPPRPAPPAGSADEAIDKLKKLDSPITYAPNMLHVPSLAVHGGWDDIVPVEHARNMVEALRSNGAAVEYEEREYAEHGLGFSDDIPYYAEWLLKHRRRTRPQRVRWVTDGRWPGAYWVARAEPSSPLEPADVAAEVSPGDTVIVTTTGCRELELDLALAPLQRPAQARMLIDGQDMGVLGTGRPALVMENGRWRRADAASEPTARAPRQAYRVLQPPFAVVYGTRSGDPELNAALRREAQALVSEWRRRYFASVPLLADTEAKSADLAGSGLVLFGGPRENSLCARLLSEAEAAGTPAPLRFAADGTRLEPEPAGASDRETLGLIMTLPRPDSPGNSAVVVWGASWRALVGVGGRFGNHFDWTVYENRWWFGCAVFDDKTGSPDSFVRVGFLGPDWRPQPGVSWQRPGEAWRELPGGFPRHLSPAKAPASADPVCLDECLPEEIRQVRGPVGFGRNPGGGRLSAGSSGRTFDRGLGVRGPSQITYRLGGAFARFTATVGADLAGKRPEDIRPPRIEYGSMVFTVRGDGRQLWTSEPLGPTDETVDVDLEVRGVRLLELEVQPAGRYDWHLGCGAWADARLYRRAGTPGDGSK